MSDVDMHAPFTGYSGKLGKIVYRRYKGRTIASLAPDPKRTLKKGEIAHRAKFADGAAYAQSAMANPDTWKIYEIMSELKDKPAFALGVGDFLTVPQLNSF